MNIPSNHDCTAGLLLGKINSVKQTEVQMLQRDKGRKKAAKSKAPSKFAVNARVRVRRGVKDPNWTDLPIGGWSGTIIAISAGNGDRLYDVKWSKETLRGLHPIYEKRAKRDDVELDTSCLSEGDLEPDSGGPLSIEAPTKIVTPALSTKNEDDRIRAALGLTGDDPVPEVTEETHEQYFRFLAERLSFPFPATHSYEVGPLEDNTVSLTVTGLEPTDDIDDGDGILCSCKSKSSKDVVLPLADIEVKKTDRNYLLVSDYSYWFVNWR